MREILFRGKAIESRIEGEWIEGSLVYIKNDKETVCKIVDTCLSSADGMMIGHDVDPETVCQYTGMKDRNGRKIFENDLIGHEMNKVEFLNGEWCINGDRPLSLFKDKEIIGNAFDEIEPKITLVMTVDIYTEESGLDPEEIKQDIAEFARGILVTGAEVQKIALALQKVESDGVSWTRQ